MQSATHSYYQATRHAPLASASSLADAATADVCIVGAGIAGCASALQLAQRGYQVVVLEAQQIGFGASGRSGGQVLPGYSSGQQVIEQQLGHAQAKQLWQWSVDAVNTCVALIKQHRIDCDLQYGHLDVAVKPRQARALADYQHELEDYGYEGLQWLDQNALPSRIGSTRYVAGLHDPNSVHIHPLNYTLGLARAAQAAGAVFHEHSAVLKVAPGSLVQVHTATGKVNAKQVLLCGNVGNGVLSHHLNQRRMAVGTYIVATEVLGEAAATALLPHNDSVADTNFILDYYRRSADHRLLFGGRVSYSGRDFLNTAEATRARMLNVFPQLKAARIDYSWGGLLDISLNRAPDFGRLHPDVYYVQGFSGHGLALATLAGQLFAEVMADDSERFDVYARLKHQHFPGGDWLRTPALMLAMLWYRLRDVL